MTKVITFDRESEGIMKAFDATRGTDVARPFLSYFRWDDKRHELVATDGKVMLILNLEKGPIFDQLTGSNWWIKLEGGVLIALSDDENEVKKFNYPFYWNFIPKADTNVRDYFKLPSRSEKGSVLKKYWPFHILSHICREADVIINPLFLDRVKSVIDEFAEVWFPHIETDDEYYARVKAEKKMSDEDRLHAQKHGSLDVAIMLQSADGQLKYVIMPMQD